MSGSRTLTWCPSSAQQKIISRCGPNARHVVKRSSHAFVRYRNHVEMGRENNFPCAPPQAGKGLSETGVPKKCGMTHGMMGFWISFFRRNSGML